MDKAGRPIASPERRAPGRFIADVSTQMQASTGSVRLAYLDGLRGWAALAVVLSHGMVAIDFALYTGSPHDSRTSWDVWMSGTPFGLVAAAGNTAVCFFFILSGFVLAHSYSRSTQGTIALAARRYFRLGVPTVIGCVLAWALIHTGLVQNLAASDITRSPWLRDVAGTDGSIRGVALAISRLLVTFDRKLGSNYNTSLWTMPVEISASLAILLGATLARPRPPPAHRG